MLHAMFMPQNELLEFTKFEPSKLASGIAHKPIRLHVLASRISASPYGKAVNCIIRKSGFCSEIILHADEALAGVNINSG